MVDIFHALLVTVIAIKVLSVKFVHSGSTNELVYVWHGLRVRHLCGFWVTMLTCTEQCPYINI